MEVDLDPRGTAAQTAPRRRDGLDLDDPADDPVPDDIQGAADRDGAVLDT